MEDKNRNRNSSSYTGDENWDKPEGRTSRNRPYGQQYQNEGLSPDLDRDGSVGGTGGFYGGTNYMGASPGDWNAYANGAYNQQGGGYEGSGYEGRNRNAYQSQQPSYNNPQRRNWNNSQGNPYWGVRNPNFGQQHEGNFGSMADLYGQGFDPYGGAGQYRPDYSQGYNNRQSGYGNHQQRPDWRRQSFNDNRQGHPESDRDWWDRTRDEVSSWFGDKEAERRRRMDEQQSGTHKGKGPKDYQRSDDRIREDVCDRLSDDNYLDASDIDVRVVGNEVTLSGTVESRSAKRRAEDLADSISGVKHVQNNLRVGPLNSVGASVIRTATPEQPETPRNSTDADRTA